MKTILTCPQDPRWWIDLDPSEIYPDDPGNGTPAMLHFDPKGPEAKVGRASGTFSCAVCEGEIFDGDCVRSIPAPVRSWLESAEEQVDDWLDVNTDLKMAAAATAPVMAGPRS